MKIGRFLFGVSKRALIRSGIKGLQVKPTFEGYQTRMDVAPDGVSADDCRYDILYAKPENRKGITLVNVHGGAYVYSTRKHNHTFANYFLEKGFDVIVVDYPLNTGTIGPDVQFKAIYAEIAHFAAHKKEFGLDQNLFISGDSAGAHYTLLLGEALTNPELRRQMELPDVDLDLRGVLLNCPVYDFSATASTKLINEYVRTQMFGPRANDKDFIRLYDPRVHFEKFELPIFLSSCKKDFIGANSRLLAEDAKKYGKNLTFIYLDTNKRGVDHVHNVVRLDLPESIQVNEGMINFLTT